MDAESLTLPVQLTGQIVLLVAIVDTLRWQRSIRRPVLRPDGPQREPYKWPHKPGQVPPKPKLTKADRLRTPRRIIVLGSIGVFLMLVSFSCASFSEERSPRVACIWSDCTGSDPLRVP